MSNRYDSESRDDSALYVTDGKDKHRHHHVTSKEARERWSKKNTSSNYSYTDRDPVTTKQPSTPRKSGPQSRTSAGNTQVPLGGTPSTTTKKIQNDSVVFIGDKTRLPMRKGTTAKPHSGFVTNDKDIKILKTKNKSKKVKRKSKRKRKSLNKRRNSSKRLSRKKKSSKRRSSKKVSKRRKRKSARVIKNKKPKKSN